MKETFYLFGSSDSVEKSGLVLGGRVYGLMGTDELRRDLTIGILWGTPVALFIGLTVSIASISIGLIYGVVAGYKGKRTDEGLMRINDLFYSLPTSTPSSYFVGNIRQEHIFDYRFPCDFWVGRHSKNY